MLNYAGGTPNTGYNLTRSLRTRASASGYLNRTFAALPTVRTKQTVSIWAKRGSLGPIQGLLAGYDGVSSFATQLYFTASDTLEFDLGGTSNQYPLITTQVFRDPSSWYHIIVSIDTTQATASDRVKLYVNGSKVTAFGTASYPDQNVLTQFAISNANNRVGSFWNGGSTYLDGYLAEVNFIDGQALTPSSFGSTNALTGVWQPARYTGTYGTNGFYLPFTDNSALTTSSNVGLGRDYSGNGNYWTTNNISITAGVTYDSMTDVPTLTSATAANYSVLNPLQPHDGGYSVAVTNGNLAVSITYSIGGNMVTVPSTIKTASSGKWYWEVTVTSTLAGGITGVGIITPDSYVEGAAPPTNNYLYVQSGDKYTNGTGTAYGATFTSGDYIGVALDVGAGTITFYKNNVSQGAAFTGLAATSYYAVVTSNATGTRSYAINFGQQPFTYTPPTGFVALNTYNLPTSTIVKGNTAMNIALDTGANIKATTEALFSGQFLEWIKDRANANNHQLLNGVTGLSAVLQSNTTAAETTYTAPSGSSVGFAWKAGSSASSNTNGSITSTVSVNASAGFSVVTYTGTGANATVGHGLGVAPSLVIYKIRSASVVWVVYSQALGNTAFLGLSNTNGATTDSTVFNNTSPTSSVLTVGTSGGTNSNTNTYVAYCFAPIAGYSAFGTYTGNGSTDGTFVYTGFRPKYVLKKRTDSTASWYINDSVRDSYNAAGLDLYADLANAELNESPIMDFLSNGFKLRTLGAALNASGGTYQYMAFAENPLKNSLAR